jgi:hypothetical protein
MYEIHIKGPGGEATFTRPTYEEAYALMCAIELAVETSGGKIEMTFNRVAVAKETQRWQSQPNPKPVSTAATVRRE